MACARCGKVAAVPGIARQLTATASQIRQVTSCAKHLRIVLWAWLLCVLAVEVGLLLSLLADHNSAVEHVFEMVPDGVMLGVLLLLSWGLTMLPLLLVAVLYRARKLLTGGGAAILFLPTLLVYAIPTYMEIQRRAKALTQAGPRDPQPMADGAPDESG